MMIASDARDAIRSLVLHRLAAPPIITCSSPAIRPSTRD